MNAFYPFENPPLPYGYDAMEPYIDTLTMRIHHDRHLQTYVDNLNKLLASYPELHKRSLEQLLFPIGQLPDDKRIGIKNNAGGVYNHRFYFNGMANLPNKLPTGKLCDAINHTYGGFDPFKAAFKAAALSVFGSGYAWLVVDDKGDLKIVTTANQDTPLTMRFCPVLTLDVWEHAYYLKHYNKRADYIDDWFNVVDWAKANANYLACFYA